MDKQEIETNEERKKEVRSGFSMALFVFLGSLVGTLLATAADLSALLNTFDRFQSLSYPEVCLVGSDTILSGFGNELATQFSKYYQVRFSVQSIGSINGLQQALNGGCVDVLAMSESLSDKNIDDLKNSQVSIECAAVIGYDAITFITDYQNQIPSLSIEQIREILMGEIDNWSMLGGKNEKIFILIDRSSGTTDYVLRKLTNYSNTRELPKNIFTVECFSSSDCLDIAVASPGSFYWISNSFLISQPGLFRVHTIVNTESSLINPLNDSFDLNEYPSELVRPLYMYVLNHELRDRNSIDNAKKFIKIVRSVNSQNTLKSFGFSPYYLTTNRTQDILPPGFEIPSSGPVRVCR